MKVDLRKSLFILPNLFTLSSVLCGFFAILDAANPNATSDDFYRASLLIVFAMFFDTVDGRVARLTKTQSAIGVQLDSLADVISFGVAPAVLVFRWSLDGFGWVGEVMSFVYIAAGTVRLARFNVLAADASGAPKTPGKYILGLPIPAAAGILVSLVVANTKAGRPAGSPYVIAGIVLALAFFMVSTVRFRSFKDLRLTSRTIPMLLIALGSTIFVALRFHVSIALVWLLGSYIAIGLIEMFVRMVRRDQRGDDADPGTDHEPDADDVDAHEAEVH